MEKIVRKLRSMKLRVLLTILVGVLAAPAVALAIVITLNGQTGRTQFFANDSNITITSSGDTHSLGWSGVLPVSRGGTGMTSFTENALIFYNGTSLAPVVSGSDGLFWGEVTSEGRPVLELRNNADMHIDGRINIHDDIQISTNAAINFTDDGGVSGLFLSSTGADLLSISDSGPQNSLYFGNSTVDRVFNFPDADGTFGLLENNQTWTGLNKFESTASSSIYIGSPTKSGCLVIGDSDGSGVTYITVNDGILTASSIKPGICQ